MTRLHWMNSKKLPRATLPLCCFSSATFRNEQRSMLWTAQEYQCSIQSAAIHTRTRAHTHHTHTHTPHTNIAWTTCKWTCFLCLKHLCAWECHLLMNFKSIYYKTDNLPQCDMCNIISQKTFLLQSLGRNVLQRVLWFLVHVLLMLVSPWLHDVSSTETPTVM